ncbi:MAG: hypothetical protein HZA52_09020, partial [Planctomycetes bacterium]|nr:hypothetical protein [Planctomycetota bacterium]
MSFALRFVALLLALGAGHASAQDTGKTGGAPPPTSTADAPAAEPSAQPTETSPAVSPAEPATTPAEAPAEESKSEDAVGDEPAEDDKDPQGLFKPEQLSKLVDALRGSDPDVFNGLLDGVSRERSLGRFLEDVNFRFKAFDAEDARDTAALGFSYEFQKALEVSPGESSSMSFVFRGRGNVAFDQRVNPEDFLDTGFELHLFGARYSNVDLDALDARLADPATVNGPGEPGREPANRFQEFFSSMAREDAELEEIFAHPTWNDLKHAVGDLLGDECFWDFAAHASVESNQDFSSLQYAYGLQYGLVIRDWNPDSNRTRFNLFDYPFAALRCLTGMQSNLTPSGRAWPALIVGFDLVDPAENTTREALNETDPFARARAELGMKSPLAVLDDG